MSDKKIFFINISFFIKLDKKDRIYLSILEIKLVLTQKIF